MAGFVLISGCAPAQAPVGMSGPPHAPQRVEIHYANGVVQGGVSRIAVALGQPVVLVVSSDVADEVHLHGFDRKAPVPAGGTASVEFVADRPGVFEAELESRSTPLAQFEIR
jgi:heme/copper-type cytochrome/quinol oxidase subunit 2